jgi:pimeloyl-ACP methyl ester carboxylesterase
MNVLRVTVSLACALLLAACTATHPYRTQATATPCEMKSFDAEAEKCASTTWERVADGYDVLYLEFDDMGLSHPKGGPGVGDAWDQIESTVQALNSMAGEGKRMTLVVFVHGWKHDARATDTNVREFHEMLRNVSLIEKALGDGRVVGIFVGWRGLSATVEPFKEGTFWARKNAALHVAQGSARHFLARLRAFQQTQNCKSNPYLCAAANSVADTTEQRREAADADVRMIIIGHSFGGLIVFNAISEHLIESLVEEGDGSVEASHSTVPVQRFGDMVILINPAFEAVRYTPLQRVAARRNYDHYQAPILVIVTSTADIATRVFFRAGRGLNTLLENEASEEESEANVRTPGFVEQYVTHDLTRCSAGNEQCGAEEQKEPCPGWKENPATVEEMKMNLGLEAEATAQFFSSSALLAGQGNVKLLPHWVRRFCGGPRLTHRIPEANDGSPYARNDPNSPIWNVRTDASLIRNHDDIDGALFAAFIRQLYRDSLLFPLPE